MPTVNAYAAPTAAEPLVPVKIERRDVGPRDVLIEIKFAGFSSGDGVKVLVDLSGVDFMASIGIRMLITTARTVASRGGKLVLLNPNENVLDVLQMTGVPDIIPVHSEESAALAELN